MTQHQILVDNWGRKHDYLRISLLEHCNLKCTYCAPVNGIAHRPSSEYMSRDELFTIAQTFVDLGVNKIRLTGGEPLVKKDFAAIALGLKEMNVKMHLTTNGVLVDNHIDTLIKAGIQQINVSIDSLNPRQFDKITMTKNLLPKIIGNIRLLLSEGFQVKINAVSLKDFTEELAMDLILWTKKNPIDVRFIEFMPFDGNKWHLDKLLSQHMLMRLISQEYPIDTWSRISSHSSDTATKYRLPGFRGTIGFISTISNPFCGGCNRLRITADGKLKNCLFSSQEADLLGALREGNDLLPLIASCVSNKKQRWAGIESFADYDPKARSMIAIGG